MMMGQYDGDGRWMAEMSATGWRPPLANDASSTLLR